MIQILKAKYQRASKDFDCDACRWFESVVCKGSDVYLNISLSDAKLWVKARRDNLKIKKGSIYLKERQLIYGRYYIFRARPEIHQICKERNIYLHDI